MVVNDLDAVDIAAVAWYTQPAAFEVEKGLAWHKCNVRPSQCSS